MAEQRFPVPRLRDVSREQFMEHLYPQVRRPAAGRQGRPPEPFFGGEKKALCCQGRERKGPVLLLGKSKPWRERLHISGEQDDRRKLGATKHFTKAH